MNQPTRGDGEIAARLLIVGCGPGGIAAAITAARHSQAGESIVVVDEQSQPGGQIWRGPASDQPQARHWTGGLHHPAIKRLQGQVVGKDLLGRFLLETDTGTVRIHAETVILATGARERFVPFPGWTLPGVFGIGGLQAMMKTGWPVDGQKLVIAGSGPLMFPVASTALGKGARVVAMAEQASFAKLARFALSLPAYPEKALEALGYLWKLRKIPQYRGVWVAQAGGDARVEWVELTNGKRSWRVACDLLAIGAHLVPNTELAALLGCQLGPGGEIQVDERLETSRKGVFAVGECTGVGGADRAMFQGRIAAWAALGCEDLARNQRPGLARWNAFTRLLETTFAPRPETTQGLKEDTIICRCEDIPHGRMRGFASWREAKLMTRCGMGPCQGRVCGPAAQVLYGWGMESVRPPVLPCRGGTLLEWSQEKETS